MAIQLDVFLINEFNPCKKDIYIPMLEEKLEIFFMSKNAVAVSNGTSAIHLSLVALGIGAGDEVLVPATAVVMSIVPILYVGAIPIFVDCKKNNIDFDYDDLETKVSNRTKAIIPVYMWGCSYNIDKLQEFSRKYGLHIIEDACQAHGSKWNNKYLGTVGNLGCFSMKNGKLLSCGEGGFILTNDDSLADRCRYLRNHCTNIVDPVKSFGELGWNYRISEVQAYLALINLNELENKIKLRQEQTEYVYSKLSLISQIKLYSYHKEERSNGFSPVFFCNEQLPDIQMAKELSKQGIINSTGTFGLIPANQRRVFIQYYKNNNISCSNTPNSSELLRNIVAISLSEKMMSSDLDYIIRSVSKLLFK